jgi:hypothetical protein
MIGKIFKSIDMFRIPVQLYYKRDFFASSLGGLVTAFVFVFLCVIFFPILKDFFTFKNFTYEVTT